MPKFPIICLEGPDGTGKSTLASVLAQKTGGVVMHQTYRYKGHMNTYHWAVLQHALRLAEERTVILDRWWPSEIAYGNTYRGGPENPYEFEYMRDISKIAGMSYVFCCPRWEQYWPRYQADYKAHNEMYDLDEATVNMVWRHYRDIMLREYHHFNRMTFHNYNLVLDQYRCDFFAGCILRGYMTWRDNATPETRAARVAINWRNYRDELERYRELAVATEACPAARPEAERHAGAPEQLSLI